MKKEKQTKGEATRLAIEDAAIELFMEQGYHATSMRQIAKRAELALGGIYNHFASKDEIFEAHHHRQASLQARSCLPSLPWKGKPPKNFSEARSIS